MTKIQNPKPLICTHLYTALQYFVLVIGYWNLEIICYLLARHISGGVLENCDFLAGGMFRVVQSDNPAG